MVDYGIDLDIGRPTTRQLSQPVDVLNLSGVITAVEVGAEATTAAVDEAVQELKKITLGTGIVIDEDLSEEVVE